MMFVERDISRAIVAAYTDRQYPTQERVPSDNPDLAASGASSPATPISKACSTRPAIATAS
jgi:hypothetical protein